MLTIQLRIRDIIFQRLHWQYKFFWWRRILFLEWARQNVYFKDRSTHSIVCSRIRCKWVKDVRMTTATAIRLRVTSDDQQQQPPSSPAATTVCTDFLSPHSLPARNSISSVSGLTNHKKVFNHTELFRAFDIHLKVPRVGLSPYLQFNIVYLNTFSFMIAYASTNTADAVCTFRSSYSSIVSINNFNHCRPFDWINCH